MRIKTALLALALPGMAGAANCRDVGFEDFSYSVCEASPTEDVRLFLNGLDGPYGSFAAVNTALEAEGAELAFAMNAGMFNSELAPVGLYIENGQEMARLVTREGPGNFGLLPNGVFCIGEGFSIVESRAFKADTPPCRYASQSGPMLVIDGALHVASGADLRGSFLLPPTLAGWKQFLELAPESGLKFTELAQAGSYWWDQSIPRDLLTAAKARRAA